MCDVRGVCGVVCPRGVKRCVLVTYVIGHGHPLHPAFSLARPFCRFAFFFFFLILRRGKGARRATFTWRKKRKHY